MRNLKITDLEKQLLKTIIDNEVDGIGKGYSEYDGQGIDNETKGVLSSLIQKDLVYDSMASFKDDHDYMPMYCTNISEEEQELI